MIDPLIIPRARVPAACDEMAVHPSNSWPLAPSWFAFSLTTRRVRSSKPADFALISSEIPSAYFTVGAAVTDTDEHFAQHHPKARFSDAELPLGAAAYTAVALGYIADHR